MNQQQKLLVRNQLRPQEPLCKVQKKFAVPFTFRVIHQPCRKRLSGNSHLSFFDPLSSI